MRSYLAGLSAKSGGPDSQRSLGRWLAERQTWLLYGIAPIAIAIALAARFLLSPVLHDYSPYLIFIPAVLVAAGLGGLGPGLLATVLGALLGFFVREGAIDRSPAEFAGVALFVAIGVGIAWSGEVLQRSRTRAS